MTRFLACLLLGFCALLLAFVTWVNVDALVGAFGDGPPYYGRTTNMDKWENPLPMLALIDALTGAFVVAAVRWAIRRISRYR